MTCLSDADVYQFRSIKGKKLLPLSLKHCLCIRETKNPLILRLEYKNSRKTMGDGCKSLSTLCVAGLQHSGHSSHLPTICLSGISNVHLHSSRYVLVSAGFLCQEIFLPQEFVMLK